MPTHHRQVDSGHVDGQETMTATDVGTLVLLDRATPVPLWYQIATQLAAAIETRHVRRGLTLPAEARLAACWRVSKPTVHHAVEALVAQGLVVRRQRGVYAVKP
jgi:GntR family transcriptional regulator